MGVIKKSNYNDSVKKYYYNNKKMSTNSNFVTSALNKKTFQTSK